MKKHKTLDTRHSALENASVQCPVPSAQRIIFLVGPSAVGKSAVALELAKRINGEIVSCDAMQVYKEVSIASDKPSPAALKLVPHHLLGVISVEDNFNAARYRMLALKAIEDVLSRGKTPIVCGGSGMYMMALLDGLFEGGGVDPVLRGKLEREADEKGSPALFERLRFVDPAVAGKIKPNDRRRIIRALEVFESTGLLLSELQKKRDGLWGKADVRVFALSRPREELYARVEERIDAMFAKGLVDEVRGISKKWMAPAAARLIGIPEVMGFLEGGYDLERAKYLMKRNTRHYVKRQLTWFRKDKRLEWIEVGTDESAVTVAERIRDLLSTKR